MSGNAAENEARKFFQSVMDEVIENMRSEFVSVGVSEDVL